MSLNKDEVDAFVSLVFGSIVKYVRQQRNQTRGPFAALLKVSTDELEWIENGTEVTVTTLYNFCEALNLSGPRITAVLQLTSRALLNRQDVTLAIRQKDWDKIEKMIGQSLLAAHDLLQLPKQEHTTPSIPAPPPKMSNEVYRLQPGAEKPMALTPIKDSDDVEEEDFEDAEPDDSAEDDEDDELIYIPETPVQAAPPKPAPARAPANQPIVEYKNAPDAGPNVTRRRPGRPRKYPVPPAT